VNYRKGVRSVESLHREYILHRALIEAVAGESELAKAKLAESQAINEDAGVRKGQREPWRRFSPSLGISRPQPEFLLVPIRGHRASPSHLPSYLLFPPAMEFFLNLVLQVKQLLATIAFAARGRHHRAAVIGGRC
jgi:hypothetical protein